ncbi:MAG TPA: tRNA dimethylallyltransferase, partial [Cytophagaceae bacterium]|nr:tRNA dimethylallyltransferase [Cytophagaceae bacterium]
FKTIKVGLNRMRNELYQRIDNRIELMLENGLVKEAETLFPIKHLNALQTVGYTEVFKFLEGEYSYTEMVSLLKRNSRQYAKRQLTWFGKDKEFKWFEANQEAEILKFVENEMRL